jgi:hypothetical protein
MARSLDSLDTWVQNAVSTVERAGFAVVEKTSDSPGCWVVWHYDESYRQAHTRVFASELEALRWAHNECAGHAVSFVSWGSTPYESIEARKAEAR